MAIKNHFEDCPYGCNAEGKLLDPNSGKMIPCPYCSGKKKSLLDEGLAVEEFTEKEVKLNTLLGVNSKYLSEVFVYDTVIPDSERIFLDEDSVAFQKEEAESLYNSLVLGIKPENSYCFGISIKGRLDRFVYPLLAKAYMNGLSVAKCISCSEFSRLQLKMNDEIDDYLNSDIVIMIINDGCTKGDIATAKGLMQTRALKGNPTLFVSTWTVEACSALLGSKSEDSTMFMARPSFVMYKKRSGKTSSYINGILGEENSYSRSDEECGVSFADL